jgi:restriction endonuclease
MSSFKYYLEMMYFEATGLGSILHIYREFAKGFNAEQMNIDHLDNAIRYLYRYYWEYIDWYKNHGNQFKNILEKKVHKEYTDRKNELEKALSPSTKAREKLQAIDNGINQLHMDYPMIAHLYMDIDDSEPEGEAAMKEYEELLNLLTELLHAQGKKPPRGGYLHEKEKRSIIKQED